MVLNVLVCALKAGRDVALTCGFNVANESMIPEATIEIIVLNIAKN